MGFGGLVEREYDQETAGTRDEVEMGNGREVVTVFQWDLFETISARAVVGPGWIRGSGKRKNIPTHFPQKNGRLCGATCCLGGW